jgi:hypothetical protein
MSIIPMKSLPLILVGVISISSNGAEPRFNRSSWVKQTVLYTIQIEKKECQNLLEQLPEVSIELDKDKVIRRILQSLGNTAVLGEAPRRQEIAEQLYQKEVVPVLAPRVEKFNEMMNQAVSQDHVSAGFLAFKGLAASLADADDMAGSIIRGTYHYNDGAFGQEGRWEWEARGEGSTTRTQTMAVKIDETIKMILEPYGSNNSLEIQFTCGGKVKLEQKYNQPLYFSEKPAAKPETTIRFKPVAVVTASKELDDGWAFKVTGGRHSSKNKEFPYAATLEIDMKAEPR